jgi:acyl-CoA-binding protein
VFVQGSYQPSYDLQLKFYSYFKQGSEGPCTESQPAFWEVVKRKKWEAWKKLGNMPKQQAMESYVDELKKVRFASSIYCLRTVI